jgi:ABC-type branched-subunit amino acid transport system ATPase component
MSWAAPLLVVDGVHVNFGGLQALTDVRFSVDRGELVALIGPNGAGKTTLLNIICGAIAPAAGSIQFNGQPIEGAPPHRINALGIGRTFQAAELLRQLTVRENVMVGGVAGAGVGLLSCLAGLPKSGRAMASLYSSADRHLEQVGLADRADEPASILPAGQQRLLGIARALATGAELLILDEPAAGLNEIEKRALGETILRLSRAGKTIVFVEHDMALVADLSQRMIVLDRGVVIADDKPEIVRADPKVIEAYLGLPAGARPIRLNVPQRQMARKPLLTVSDLMVSYGGLRAVDGVSLEVCEGEIVALVGANGAGKSSLLKAVARVGPVAAGTMSFGDSDISRLEPEEVVVRGINLVPEGRQLFPSLTVADNLEAGRYARLQARGFANLIWRSSADQHELDERLFAVYELFPILKERRRQLAGTLSGGQGQMLAIGRALMASPRLLMLDEPSLGLAPLVVEEIMHCLVRLRAEGLTILLVEQNARAALEIADRAYVMATGRVVESGLAADLLSDERVSGAYLGWRADDLPARNAKTRILQGRGEA